MEMERNSVMGDRRKDEQTEVVVPVNKSNSYLESLAMQPALQWIKGNLERKKNTAEECAMQWMVVADVL